MSIKCTTGNNLETMRHSMAHIMAAAVLGLWPDVRFAIGPAIENGFYYDFDFGDIKISEDDLPKIEAEMLKIIDENYIFEKSEMSVSDAIVREKELKQIYKEELIRDLKKTGENKVSYFRIGNFIDLCRGPQILSTGKAPKDGFKLTKIAGAYWRGDEKNKMLTRIYGVAFESKKELEDYMKMMEEAEKRDHRKLGKELKIFVFDDEVGPGLPLWLPNGAVIIEELERLAKEMEEKAGYVRVRTPHLTKEDLYLRSGHLPYYSESMYPPMELEGVKYYVKPMNCPMHHKIFGAHPRSYRELPIRLAEHGTCYRYEKSGELFGLMRVRSMQMNDAHIYCSETQFKEEFMGVIDLYKKYFDLFGIDKYVMRLSLHSKEGLGKKYVDNERLWEKTEDMVRRAMTNGKVPFIEVLDEAAFYGPKIDVQIWSAIGREFTLATNQVDFAVPERFELKFFNNLGKEEIPLCIHRAPLSTHERMIGFLIEHYAGAFPVWLSPVQIKIVSVGEGHVEFSKKLAEEFRSNGIRVEVDDNNETVGNKIRKATGEKVPYMLVIGDREMASDKLSVRDRGSRETREISKEDFIKEIREKIEKRT